MKTPETTLAKGHRDRSMHLAGVQKNAQTGGAASVICVLFVLSLVYAYMYMSTHITYIDIIYDYYYYYYYYYYYICMYIIHHNTVLL